MLNLNYLPEIDLFFILEGMMI